MDALSEVLSICRAVQAVPARFVLTAPWALESSGVHAALLRLGTHQPYWLEVEGLAPILVQPNDLVMIPFGSPHRMYSEPGLTPIPFHEVMTRSRYARGTPFTFGLGGGGAESVIFSSFVQFSAYCRSTVIRILPKLIHLREQDFSVGPILTQSMRWLIEETLTKRAGWQQASNRLADLMLIHILREHLEFQKPAEQSWLRGLTDPAISRAIALIHREPAREWSVNTLAQNVGMSRSRFAALFSELVGVAPIDYLTSHRMAIAAGLLEEREMPMAEIAEQAGYRSEKAFARAFTSWAGQSPSRYARSNRRKIGSPTPQ